MLLSYHASHEQFTPRALLELADAAEAAGFDAIASSDHLAPWSERAQVSGAAWPWLATVLERTALPVSVVTTPGWRYPPLVLAQTMATLAHLHPGRLTVTLGSGEALNERLVSEGWPIKAERDRLLQRNVEHIAGLLRGREPGDARLYLLPDEPPDISVAAVTAPTAGWIGGWWDRLTTVADTVDATRQRVDAFRDARGDAGHVILKLQITVDADRETAIDLAHREWGVALVGAGELTELPTPSAFEAAAAATVTRARVAEQIRPITSRAELVDVIGEFGTLDPDVLIVHDVAPAQGLIPLFAG